MTTKRMREDARIFHNNLPPRPIKTINTPEYQAWLDKIKSRWEPKPFHQFDSFRYDISNTECAYCTKMFKSSEARKYHEEHCSSSELKWKCDDCGKKYKTQKGLTWHQQKHQEIQTTYICRGKGCSASYQSLSELRKHCYLYNCAFPEVEGPVLEDEQRCEICYKVYKQYSMEVHMEEHQRRRNELHKCEYCDFFSIRKNNLIRHEEAVHNVWNINFELIKKHFFENDLLSSYHCPRCKKICETYEDAVAHLKLKK